MIVDFAWVEVMSILAQGPSADREALGGEKINNTVPVVSGGNLSSLILSTSCIGSLSVTIGTLKPPCTCTSRPEELTCSSVVFAVDSFDQHAHFLRTAKTMAAFGRLASTREWADRPPITQYHRCWRLDHRTTTCQQPPRCRICGEEHEESHYNNPLAPTTDDAEMQVDQDARANQLTNPSCINCKYAGLEATDHPAN